MALSWEGHSGRPGDHSSRACCCSCRPARCACLPALPASHFPRTTHRAPCRILPCRASGDGSGGQRRRGRRRRRRLGRRRAAVPAVPRGGRRAAAQRPQHPCHRGGSPRAPADTLERGVLRLRCSAAAAAARRGARQAAGDWCLAPMAGRERELHFAVASCNRSCKKQNETLE